MSVLGLVIDGVLMLLLSTTLWYCAQLSRRLKALHTGQDGMRDLIAGLDRSTDRAQASLTELRSLGAGTAAELKAERTKGEALLEELSLIVGSADRVANRLDELRSPERGTNTQAQKVPAASMKSMQSGDILQALRQAR